MTHEDMESILTFDLAIDAVEGAYKAAGRGEAVMPSKLYLELPDRRGDFRAMPAFVFGWAGVKWVNVHPENPSRGLPTVMATLVLNQPETGFPLAIMDATAITDYRTGAAGAVAVKHLAPTGAETLGFVGAGAQAKALFFAILRIFRPERAIAWSRSGKVAWLEGLDIGVKIELGSLEEAASCDVVCTATPSRRPLVEDRWVKRNSLIVAVGADAPGKEELDPGILKRAKVIVDDVDQAVHSGEINVPIAAGIMRKSDIHATIGEVLAGLKKGREGEETIVFDSTGIAIQDVALAAMVYDAAKKQGLGSEVELIGKSLI